MKRLFLISISLLFIILMLTACPSIVPDNQPPTIELKPINDIETETLPYNLTVGATATDNKGIRKVEFSLYKDGKIENGPISKTVATHGNYYTHTFSINDYGSYEVKVRAQDIGNNWSETKSDSFAVRKPAANHPPTIESIVWNDEDIVQGKLIARDGKARFTVNYSDPDGNVVKIIVTEEGGNSQTYYVSAGQTSKYIEYNFSNKATVSNLRIRVVDEGDLYDEDTKDNIYVLDNNASVKLNLGAISLRPGINMIPIQIENWKDGVIDGKVELYVSRGGVEVLESSTNVSGFITAELEIPIALINVGSNDIVSIRFKYIPLSGQTAVLSQVYTGVISLDTNPPRLYFVVPQVIAEGEPLVFTLHATDEILESLPDIRISVYPNVNPGQRIYLEDLVCDVAPSSPLFVRYRIKIEGDAYNRLGNHINPHTSWIEIRRRCDYMSWATGTDYSSETGRVLPYVIKEIDRSRQPNVKPKDIAEYFDATVTVYVDFILINYECTDTTGSSTRSTEVWIPPIFTSNIGIIDEPVSSIVDAFLESGEEAGQAWEYEIEVTMKDWKDVNSETTEKEHFDVEEDEETPQIEIWVQTNGQWQNVTGNKTIDMMYGDQLYIKAKDNVSLHWMKVDITSTQANFVDLQPAYSNNDLVFSEVVNKCFSCDPATDAWLGHDPDWTRMHKEYTAVYEAPDTPGATFILKVYVSDRSFASVPVYDPTILPGVPSHSERDAVKTLEKEISIKMRCDKTYAMIIKEGDLVSYPTDTVYLHYRFPNGKFYAPSGLYKNWILNDFKLYPQRVTRKYKLTNWQVYEDGNYASELRMPIIGGPSASNTILGVITSGDTERVDVYLVPGFYPDTGSLVASHVDLDNVAIASLTILYPDHYPRKFGSAGYEKGVEPYASNTTYIYWWRLNAEDMENSIPEPGYYTFVVVPMVRTAQNEWISCDTSEFPFIYDGPVPVPNTMAPQGLFVAAPHVSPEIFVYKTPLADDQSPNMGPTVIEVEPNRTHMNPELIPPILSLEFVDDYAGVYVDGSSYFDQVEDIRKQVRFEAITTNGGAVLIYPTERATRSLIEIYNHSYNDSMKDPSFVVNNPTPPPSWYPKTVFVGLDVFNHFWENMVPPSNEKQLHLVVCDELNNCGEWKTWANIVSIGKCKIRIWPPKAPLDPPAHPINATYTATYVAVGDYADLLINVSPVCSFTEHLGYARSASDSYQPEITSVPKIVNFNDSEHLNGFFDNIDSVELFATLSVFDGAYATTLISTDCALVDTLFATLGNLRNPYCKYSDKLRDLGIDLVITINDTFVFTATDSEVMSVKAYIDSTKYDLYMIGATPSTYTVNFCGISTPSTYEYEAGFSISTSAATPPGLDYIDIVYTAIDLSSNAATRIARIVMDNASPQVWIGFKSSPGPNYGQRLVKTAATDNYYIANVKLEYAFPGSPVELAATGTINDGIYNPTEVYIPVPPQNVDLISLYATFTAWDLACQYAFATACATIDTMVPRYSAKYYVATPTYSATKETWFVIATVTYNDFEILKSHLKVKRGNPIWVVDIPASSVETDSSTMTYDGALAYIHTCGVTMEATVAEYLVLKATVTTFKDVPSNVALIKVTSVSTDVAGNISTNELTIPATKNLNP